ncbi:unnamed protein product, partial [Durusdinium trenchii]
MQINQKASRAMSVLKSAGLAYNAKLKPREILVHVANRGGQMVNPHDVVSKGQQISAVGWDLNKVRQSVAIEMPHDVGKRRSVIAANEKLSDQRSGMLARPFGEERYCSLSSSHLTAFLRCLESGCRMGNDQLSMEQLIAQGGDHGIVKPPTELEVAMTIAQHYELQAPGQKDLDKAVQQAASSLPPCKAYIRSIGDFVSRFAGGESFKLL